jgi:chromosomal replication initiator protein
VALAREALGDLLRHSVRVLSVADIDTATCAAVRLSPGALQSKSRSWAVSHPRMLAVYLARKLTSATYGEIAKHFGVRQHSTAVAAEKKVRSWIAESAVLPLGDRQWAVQDLLERIERDASR